MLAPWKKSYDKHRQYIKKQRHYFPNKGPASQSYGFFSCYLWMWELNYKESGVPKNWCFWTVVLEKTLKSLLDCKEIQPVHPKGNQPWIFIGRTDDKAETPILWPHDLKNWLIRKDPDAGKNWRQKEKGMTENEIVGWHYQLNGHEFEQALGVGDGQGSLVFCSPWGHKESDMTDWTDLLMLSIFFYLYFIFCSEFHLCVVKKKKKANNHLTQLPISKLNPTNPLSTSLSDGSFKE